MPVAALGGAVAVTATVTLNVMSAIVDPSLITIGAVALPVIPHAVADIAGQIAPVVTNMSR